MSTVYYGSYLFHTNEISHLMNLSEKRKSENPSENFENTNSNKTIYANNNQANHPARRGRVLSTAHGKKGSAGHTTRANSLFKARETLAGSQSFFISYSEQAVSRLTSKLQ